RRTILASTLALGVKGSLRDRDHNRRKDRNRSKRRQNIQESSHRGHFTPSLDPFSLGCQLRIIASMPKLSVNVAAALLFVALVILAQAPDGAATSIKGPDAVAANLVNTVCASCHTLDRVKNKVGDKDAWTTTVTRMQSKGAA